MRQTALVVAALLAAACGSSPKPAAPAPAPVPAPAPSAVAPKIAAQEQYYDIYGSSVAELRDQISRLGPAGGDDALTVWELESQYGTARTADGCALRNVQVTLTVTTTLPRWTPPQDAPARLRASWRTYLQRVKLHEAGHRQIAERNARDLMAALAGLRAGTCEKLGDEASQTVERIVAEGRLKNRAYDVETKHGQTQGVVLGP